MLLQFTITYALELHVYGINMVGTYTLCISSRFHTQ